MIPLRIGYLPLTDSAPLIAARHFGFAEAEGLALDLQRDVSWANLRDKLMVGHLDGAHLLAPMAIAATLGVGHVRFALCVPYVLSLNGNAITLSPELAEAMLALDSGALASWTASAQILGMLVEKRQAQGRGPLTFAVVFPFSTHTYLLRRFLQSGGIDPDKDVQIVVVPPSYMVDSMGQGLIDGFCVGSPWNSVAVAQGRGVIAALGSEICADAPEKVLAVPVHSPVMQSDVGERLLRALQASAAFVAAVENVDALSDVLARPDYVNCPASIIARTLRGALVLDKSGRTRSDAGFVRFAGRAVTRPDAAKADWLYGEMIAAGQIAGSQARETAARAVFDADIYDSALADDRAHR